MADKLSKMIFFGNWFVTPDVFDKLTGRQWVIAKIDRFASEKNQKTKLKFISSEILGVDALAFD